MTQNTHCKYNNKVSSKNAVFLFKSSKKSIVYSISVYMKSNATSRVKRGATTGNKQYNKLFKSNI